MRVPDGIDFEQYIEFVGDAEAQEIHPAPEWTEQLIDLAANGDQILGDPLPWSKTHDKFALAEGDLTIWGGMSGHRKSMVLGFVMLSMAQHSRVAIASLEMKPEQTLLRMAKQATTCHPSEQAVKRFLETFGMNILVYDQLDRVKQEKILGFVHYCAKVQGCRHIVIDSLTKCGISSGDYEAEKSFIDRLQWAAKTLKCHVHLVCHVRKPHSMGEEYIPNKFDVRGAGELTDLPDNIILCWANKEKAKLEEAQQMGMQLNEKQQEKIKQADQKLIIAKQRSGHWEGAVNLWFHPESLQFTPSDRRQAMPLRCNIEEGG